MLVVVQPYSTECPSQELSCCSAPHGRPSCLCSLPLASLPPICTQTAHARTACCRTPVRVDLRVSVMVLQLTGSPLKYPTQNPVALVASALRPCWLVRLAGTRLCAGLRASFCDGATADWLASFVYFAEVAASSEGRLLLPLHTLHCGLPDIGYPRPRLLFGTVTWRCVALC